MSLKIEFVERVGRGERIAPLCREFGISRTAGHKWLKRFRERGYEGLEELSRRPASAPLATAEEVVLAVLEARESHPSWGPRKLHGVLHRRFGVTTPSARTIARILKRAKKVRERRRRSPPNVVDRAPTIVAQTPNDVWTVDFKGYWRSGDGARCEPLTVRDAFSRFVLTIELCKSTTADVRAVFERLFRKHGLPNALRCDNGVPFVAVQARGGISALSAWWISLGIRLVRSRVGCPQDNGGHERMHRDVAADVERQPAANPELQQRALSRWRQEFNQVRPHEALNNKTPAEVYVVADKRPMRSVTFTYPENFYLRRVLPNGTVKLASEWYHVTKSLHGHTVGIETVSDFHARVWFHDIDLGLIEIVPKVRAMTLDLLETRRTRKRSRAA